MTTKIFITGTDTDAGKTFTACVLENYMLSKGYKVLPYKPIVAGFENGHNADLDSHLRATQCGLDPFDITAYAYEEPIAPHIAAMKLGENIEFARLDFCLQKLASKHPDFIVVEGAGGWLLPIGNNRVLPNWPAVKDMKVVLVVGMKLGCLNHALLTAKIIEKEGFTLAGFITKEVTKDRMPYYHENLETLKAMLNCPFIGEINYIESGNFRDAKVKFDISSLLK